MSSDDQELDKDEAVKEFSDHDLELMRESNASVFLVDPYHPTPESLRVKPHIWNDNMQAINDELTNPKNVIGKNND